MKEEIDKNLIGKFKKHDIKTPYFSLNGYKSYVRVIDIIDGDTLVIIMEIFDKFYKFTIRLAEIDTYEIKSENEEIHNHGIKARNRVLELLMENNDQNFIDIKNKNNITRKEIQNICDVNIFIVYIECFDYDKYGRILGKIYIGEKDNKIDISKLLLNENLAYEYHGESKLTETEQLIKIKKINKESG